MVKALHRYEYWEKNGSKKMNFKKKNLKNVSTSLNNLKSKVDKLDIDKLLSILVNLSKLRKQ